jgi:hypothetical protein
MANFRTSRLFDAIFLALLAVLLWWVYANRIMVADWLYFRTYEPPARVVEIADSAGLSPAGRRLLYRTNPQFVSPAAMAENCGQPEDLGCLSENGTAYILADTAHDQDVEVTAVHEMLHLAYRRLSNEQQTNLAPLLNQAISQNAAHISEQLTGHQSAADHHDEAHSILGTEYENLPPALEQYYGTYFLDRTKLLVLSAQARH